MAKAVRIAVRNDTYQLGPEYQKRIQKQSGTGFRTISVPNIEDRMLSRGIVQILQLFIDPLFDDCSHGFRPRRGRWTALAHAERLAFRDDHFVWVVADIQDAFGSVPVSRLLQIVAHYLPHKQLVELIRRTTARTKPTGLRQGPPSSPLLLNMFLHHHVDRWWRTHYSHIGMLRFADDFLLMARNMNEAREAFAVLAKRLKPNGMRLKKSFEDSVYDLCATDTATWLGYSIRKAANNLRFGMAIGAWPKLQHKFAEIHEHSDSPLRACHVISGWLKQLAPCYPHVTRDVICNRIMSIARSQAFDEIPGRVELISEWEQAHVRWTESRKRTEAAQSQSLTETNHKSNFTEVPIDDGSPPWDESSC
jgi:hypothetical protein